MASEGDAALSNPHQLDNVLHDLLPDMPRESQLLVAAAELGAGRLLRQQMADHVDPRSAVRLTADMLGRVRPFDGAACRWVIGEYALALGLDVPDPTGELRLPVSTPDPPVPTTSPNPPVPTSPTGVLMSGGPPLTASPTHYVYAPRPAPPPQVGPTPRQPPPRQPPPRQPPRRRRVGKLGVALIVVAVLVVVAGGATAALVTLDRSPTTTTPAAPDAGAGAARNINAALVQSEKDRTEVTTAYNDVQACRADPTAAARTVEAAATTRATIISNLKALDVSQLPNGTTMRNDLVDGLQASLGADQDYAAWMQDVAAGTAKCDGAATDPRFQAGNNASAVATKDKDAFLALWNPLAPRYGLPTYQEDQL